MTRFGKGPFTDFFPFAPMSAADVARGRWSEPSQNAPAWNSDLLDCRNGKQEKACFYLKLPAGVGFPVYNGTDIWTSSWVHSMKTQLGKVKPPKAIYIEYGRKFVTPGQSLSAPQIRPVWTLDFSSVGNGATYFNYGAMAGANGSVGWHQYTMPVAGRVVASWFHTHAHAAVEMWVLAGEA